MSYVGDPIKFAEVVTPSDVINLSAPSRCLFVGVAGNVSVQMYGDDATVIIPVQVGVNPIQCTRVNATGTTASGIVAGR